MKSLFASLRLLFAITLLTGIIYPLAVTLVGQTVFPHQANGSLILKDGKAIGSELIAQKFTQEKYFWARPSAIDYNPLPSGGSNLGPTSKKLSDSVKDQHGKFIDAASLPPDLIFTSASGLDPHISPEAAHVQLDRIMIARGWDQAQKGAVQALISKFTAARQMRFLGEKRVNVLALNMALDEVDRKSSGR